MKLVSQEMEKKHSEPYAKGGKASGLFKRSGEGLKSINSSIRVTGSTIDSIRGTIGGNYYMRVHEYGATIRPTKSIYLTIPLDAALDQRGVPIKKSAREWDNTFVMRSKKGNLIIFQRRGREVVPLYLLVTEVTIRPRLGMGKYLEDSSSAFLSRVADRIEKELFGG
jgi:hypothetical protein